MVSNSNVSSKSALSKKAYWEKHIKLRYDSGLSMAEYCRINNLAYHQFKYQERKLAKKSLDKNALLLPVKLVEQEEVSDSKVSSMLLCTLKLRAGHQLNIFDTQVLPALLSVLV